MFTLQDGREHLYQWDLDRYIIVEDNTICEVHFCNRTSDCSLVVEVKDGLAPIPNILLQEARPIRAYAYCDDKYTLTEQQFTVKSRTRPDDYVYTETDVITVRDMVDRADKTLEQTSEALANSEEALANATAANNTANETLTLAQEAVADMDKLVADAAQSAYDANEAAKRAEEAADYYTKAETDTLISDSKDVIYLDVENIGNTSTSVGADQASVLDRLANGEALSVYLKFSAIEYFPARLVLYSDTSIVLNTPDVANNNNGDIENYEYWFSKSGSSWTAKRDVDSKPKLVTHEELSNTLTTYYTKEDTNQAIADAHEVFYFDFCGILSQSVKLTATEEQASAIERIFNGEPLSILIKTATSSNDYVPVEVSKVGETVQFQTHYFNKDNTAITNYRYKAVKSNGVWTITRIEYTVFDYTTADTVQTMIDEAIADAVTGDIDLTNYYTKAQTDKAISDAVDAIEVDFTGYATEDYVTTAINNALSGIATAEGGSY